MHETDANVSKSNASNSAYAIPTEEVANLLDDWWANYAVFKNVEYSNDVAPDLNATVAEDYAVTMLHYSLNIALVNLDSTYEDVTADSVFYSYTLSSDNPVLTKANVCTAFDNIKDQIKAKLQSTELDEKTINRITIDDNSTSDEGLNLKVIFEATGGKLIATREPDRGPNVETSFFPTNASIPWASKQSGAGNSASTNPFYNYWYWLFTGNPPSTLAEKDQGFNMLPSDKPAHKYLSSSQVFWPTQDVINPGSNITWGKYYKPVMSPQYTSTNVETFVQITNKTSANQDPTDQLGSQDVMDCGNPHKDDQDQHLQDASYVLSYDQPESAYGLQTTRNLDGAALNYYWIGRIPAAAAGYYKKASKIATKFTIPELAGGYYAVTKLVYRVHDNGQTLQVCYYITCGVNTLSVCDRQANYVVDERFDHFTIQHRTPNEFASIFA